MNLAEQEYAQNLRDQIDFDAARDDDMVIKEFLTQIDYSDEIEYLLFVSPEANEKDLSERLKIKDLTIELMINDEILSDCIKYFIKTSDLYANRFRDELINEYRSFYK